jgi:TnpA family transposase
MAENGELRRRIHADLSKGGARKSSVRDVLYKRLGEICDRSIEHQRYRASELDLETACIASWTRHGHSR